MNLIGRAPAAPRSHFNLSVMPAAHHKRVGDERNTSLWQSSLANSTATIKSKIILIFGTVSATYYVPTDRSTPWLWHENMPPTQNALRYKIMMYVLPSALLTFKNWVRGMCEISCKREMLLGLLYWYHSMMCVPTASSTLSAAGMVTNVNSLFMRDIPWRRTWPTGMGGFPSGY
jgi:hypothetical protein